MILNFVDKIVIDKKKVSFYLESLHLINNKIHSVHLLPKKVIHCLDGTKRMNLNLKNTMPRINSYRSATLLSFCWCVLQTNI